MAVDRNDAVVSLSKRRGLRLSVRGDLRRHSLCVGLRPARRGAEGEHQTTVVALCGADPRRRCRPRLVGDPGPPRSGRRPVTWRRSSTHWWSASPVIDGSVRTTCRRTSRVAKASRTPSTVSMANVACPHCGTKGAWTQPRMFNGLLKTYLGPVESEEGLHYLRPETAQGIFINFLNVMNSRAGSHRSGSARSARAFATRSRPATSSSAPASSSRWSSSTSSARHRRGVARVLATAAVELVRRPRHRPESHLRLLEHPKEKLSHYSTRTVDIEYASTSVPTSSPSWRASPTARTSTSRHTRSIRASDLSYFDQEKGERWTPYVIEPAAGLTRAMLAFLLDAYAEDEAPNAKGGVEKRTVLRLDPRLAPVKTAVLPLSRNADLSPKAKDLAADAAAGLERASSTTPVPSAGVTDGRTRSARRSASRWTSRHSTTTR